MLVAKTCLLITDTGESTADLLVMEMRRRGQPCVRWNLDRYPVGSSLSTQISDAACETVISTDGRRVHLSDVGSVWCRSMTPTGFPDDFNTADRKFAEIEASRALDGLLSLPGIVWVNHPHRYALANSKPAQLRAARQAGMAIPQTLVSNDPDAVRAFIAAAPGPVVYKCFSQWLDLPEGQAQYTGIVTDEQVARLDLIRATPGVFQHYVDKAFELRVTVVGNRLFAGRINSQMHETSRIDWRHRPFDMDPTPYDLPEPVRTAILTFMSGFGLLYGALDFIVTPEGRHVFLEVNPGGQYMWVEAATKMPITQALVDVLSGDLG